MVSFCFFWSKTCFVLFFAKTKWFAVESLSVSVMNCVFCFAVTHLSCLHEEHELRRRRVSPEVSLQDVDHPPHGEHHVDKAQQKRLHDVRFTFALRTPVSVSKAKFRDKQKIRRGRVTCAMGGRYHKMIPTRTTLFGKTNTCSREWIFPRAQ